MKYATSRVWKDDARIGRSETASPLRKRRVPAMPVTVLRPVNVNVTDMPGVTVASMQAVKTIKDPRKKRMDKEQARYISAIMGK